jgi:hypothetical protein
MWKTKKSHNVSETGSVSVLRWMGQDKPTQLGPLERATLTSSESPIALYKFIGVLYKIKGARYVDVMFVRPFTGLSPCDLVSAIEPLGRFSKYCAYGRLSLKVLFI